MASKNIIPLGYLDLPDGLIAISAMNNIFLNFTFEDMANWESLRLVVNLVLDAYIKETPNTTAKTIEGSIKVRTQFQHLLKNDGKTTRDQDIKITEDDDEATYLEFQNRAKTNKPLEIRAVEYFGLGISRSNGAIANQMWLLAEDVESVLHNKTFSRYIFKDEATGDTHPSSSSIMYVSLPKLSQENSPAGELALFLLRKISAPSNENVKQVADAFNASFNAFKLEKELSNLKSSGNE